MSDPTSEQSLFFRALELSTPDDRAAYLDEACRDNPGLRAELDALLAAHDRLGGGMPHTTEEQPAGPGPDGEEIGAVLSGRYKLVELLGEGGMGAVWMAQQTEPVRRLVAVKVVKAGMDSKQVLARFEAERQALALMDHPNIARVLDAGTTMAGRPYFVMELVKGVPLTRYCDEQRLTPRQRLELFVPVCQAIQHAHQKGVIHRDIKPSNVLVALYDGRPVPKVIDFGIAKAAGQPLTDRTLVTGFGSVVGTLEYMSPEQAELNQLDIDTRSDVYSLGVLLYELLTGSTPLEKKRLQQAALLEVLRIIREEEPPRPSTRLSTTDELPAVAANRSLEPKRLSGVVRGELDWIVMKTLEKDRNRRYQTAAGLALDVERYLADEPVQACPPSVWYRWRKAARRHRWTAAVTLILLLAAAMGAANGLWWLQRRTAAEAEVRLTLAEAERLHAGGKSLEALSAARRAVSLLAAGPVRAALAQQARDMDADLAMVARLDDIRQRGPANQTDYLKTALSNPTYEGAFRDYGIDVMRLNASEAAERIRAKRIRMELVQGLELWAIGLPNADRKSGAVSRATLLAVVRGADPDPWRDRWRDAWARDDVDGLKQLARAELPDDQPPGFLAVYGRVLRDAQASKEAWALLRKAQRRHPGDFWVNHDLAYSLHNNVSPASLSSPALMEEACRFYTAALARRPDSAAAYLNLAFALSQTDHLDAVPLCHEAIRLQPDSARAYHLLGVVLDRKGAVDEAIAAWRQALKLQPDYPYSLRQLSRALLKVGKRGEALALGAQVAAAYRRLAESNPDSATGYFNLGIVLGENRQWDEAAAAYRRAIEINPNHGLAYSNLGAALRAKGKLDEAITAFRQASKRAPSESNFGNLGLALHQQNKLDEAIAAYREALRLNKDNADTHYTLGNALRDMGRPEEAIAEFREAIQLKKDFAEAHCNLGQMLRRQGQFRQALEELRQGHELGSKNPRWNYTSAQWVRECERLAELDDKLPRILKGEAKPVDAAERLELAQLCQLPVKSLNAAAVRFYTDAFAADPKATDDLAAAHRYNAACAAALAGVGQGQDTRNLDDKERGRLRDLALGWLRADVAACTRVLDTDKEQTRTVAVERMKLSLTDPDFAGVRDAEALIKLPERERQAWQQVWGEVRDRLAKAQRPAKPDKAPVTK
jgi:tetratricopeptide (TPR) repeat protein